MTKPMPLLLAVIAVGSALPLALGACGAENANLPAGQAGEGVPCGLTPEERAAPVVSATYVPPDVTAEAGAPAAASAQPGPR